MKFAYLITCHKNEKQVARLINRLQVQDAVFVLHVSKNCENGFFNKIKLELEHYNNVFFCKREDGTHNGFGIVKGTMNALELLFDNKIEFDYVNLISGQDYPIKSNIDVSRFFEENNGSQFFDYFPLFPKEGDDYEYDNFWGPDRQTYRVDRFHFIIDKKVRSIPEIETFRLINNSLFETIKIFLSSSSQYIKEKRWLLEFKLLFWSRILPRKRKIPTDFEIYGSKTWWSITYDAAKYVLEQHKHNKRYRQFFKYTLIPDEMYVHTILLNSSFAQSCVNNDLRDIEWVGGDGTHPIIFRTEHFERLKNSKDLFARKFDIAVDSKILDLIDEEILNK